jgi:hypothetical protein
LILISLLILALTVRRFPSAIVNRFGSHSRSGKFANRKFSGAAFESDLSRGEAHSASATNVIYNHQYNI